MEVTESLRLITCNDSQYLQLVESMETDKVWLISANQVASNPCGQLPSGRCGKTSNQQINRCTRQAVKATEVLTEFSRLLLLLLGVLISSSSLSSSFSSLSSSDELSDLL